MDDFKFRVGEYVVFNKPSKYDGDNDTEFMHGKTFIVRYRWKDESDEKPCNKYDLGMRNIEEEALSLAIPLEATPDYNDGDIVVIAHPDIGYEKYQGKVCEILKTDKFSDEDDCCELALSKISLALLKPLDSDSKLHEEWFYPHEFEHEKSNIEPITENEIMSIVG